MCEIANTPDISTMNAEEIQELCEKLATRVQELIDQTELRQRDAFAWQAECEERIDGLEYLRDYLDMASNQYIEDLP